MNLPILDSTLTWEELQQKCLEVFGPQAVFGSKRSAKDIGVGKGNVARSCLIEPDWHPSLEPKNFLAKICIIPKDPSGAKDSDYAPTTMMLHNVECNAYNLLTKYKNDKILFPMIYSTVPFTEQNTHTGYILMEYIGDAETLNIWDNLEVEEVKQALRVVAALQALSLKFTEEEKESLRYNPLYDIFLQVKQPNTDISKTVVSNRGPFNEFINGTHVEASTREFLKILPEIYDLDYLYTNMGKELGISQVLVHGDAWSTNFLWRRTDRGLRLVSILDFQTAYLGMPGGDVLRVISTFLSQKDRRKHWNELIDYFFKTFTQMIGTATPPFNKEQLIENIKRYYPMVRLVFAIPLNFDKNQRHFDEETRTRVKEVLLEKMEGIVLDTLFYHERNNRIKNKS